MAGSAGKMISLLTNSLGPIFVGLAIGYLAGLAGVVDNHNIRPLVGFLMTFAVPCALFLAIAHTSLRQSL